MKDRSLGVIVKPWPTGAWAAPAGAANSAAGSTPAPSRTADRAARPRRTVPCPADRRLAALRGSNGLELMEWVLTAGRCDPALTSGQGRCDMPKGPSPEPARAERKERAERNVPKLTRKARIGAHQATAVDLVIRAPPGRRGGNSRQPA